MAKQLSAAALAARRRYQQAWRDKNREHLRAYYRKWKKANREKIESYSADYWERKAAESKEKDRET